ncbi:hypothetical protein INR49_028193 [Caranx melampygus]|nr:hypothetical protein INR49_028193 [Caranx melampygus]
MDIITFQHDTVLSDVHMFLPNTRHLMTRLNHVGQPVFISKFRILSDVERHDNSDPGKRGEEEEHSDVREDREEDSDVTKEEAEEEEGGGTVEPSLDKDGDLDVTHRPRRNPGGRDVACPVILKQSHPGQEEEEQSTDDEDDESFKGLIRIEHTMATPLEDVGKQVWRGAFLLADFILSEPLMFRGATVLELGAGTGLTSIVLATVAKTVYCTAVANLPKLSCTMDDALPDQRTSLSVLLICADADVEFSWTEEEVADLYDNTTFIIAADVCYDDDLTDGFFRTLYQLCSSFTHTCTIFISIEKRMNFTLRYMDVSCEAYNHFSLCLSQLQDLVDGRCSFRVEQIPSNFAQFLLYERIEQLELWKVTASPLPCARAQSDSKVSVS